MSAFIQPTISKPCHENWDGMTASEQGRFCASCQKTVIDFSMMNDREILDALSGYNGEMCGRFSEDQLDKSIALTDKKKRAGWLYLWNLMVTTVLFTFNASSQDRTTNNKQSIENAGSAALKPKTGVLAALKLSRKTLSGIILDKDTNEPVPFATIHLNGPAFNYSADSTGMFLVSPEDAKTTTLKVSAIGYKTSEFSVVGKGVQQVVYLERDAKLMSEVTVVGYGRSVRRSCTTGALLMVSSTKLFSNLKTWVPDKRMTVYPNPILAGQLLRIDLSLKQTGAYTLRLLTTDGKLVHFQNINVQNKNQTLNVPVNGAWAKGTYWLIVNGKTNKEESQAKVVIQ